MKEELQKNLSGKTFNGQNCIACHSVEKFPVDPYWIHEGEVE